VESISTHRRVTGSRTRLLRRLRHKSSLRHCPPRESKSPTFFFLDCCKYSHASVLFVLFHYHHHHRRRRRRLYHHHRYRYRFHFHHPALTTRTACCCQRYNVAEPSNAMIRRASAAPPPPGWTIVEGENNVWGRAQVNRSSDDIVFLGVQQSMDDVRCDGRWCSTPF
jgi:hypothetical protein